MQLYQEDWGKRHPAVFSHRPTDRLATTTLLSIVAIAAMAFSVTAGPAEAQTAQPVKNVVLVHGAFADGSGWEAVAKILEKDGYKVSVAQPPETSYAEDVKYTKAAIDAMNGPGGSGRPQLWRVHHHRGRQRSERFGTGLHRRLCAR